jgi:hypothetical protein
VPKAGAIAAAHLLADAPADAAETGDRAAEGFETFLLTTAVGRAITH